MESFSKPIFAKTAGEPFEVWEVGAVRLDTWLPRRGHEPYRPWVVLCRSAGRPRPVPSDPGEGDSLPALVRGALTRAAAQWKSRPARVEVADAELAGILEPLLAGTGALVEVNPDLPELHRRLKELALHIMPDDPTPGPLTGAGVTLRQLSAFAGAAAELLEAPWALLTGGDLVRVEAPEVDASLRWFSLEDCGGRPRLVFEDPELDAPRQFEDSDDDEDWDEEDLENPEEDPDEDEEHWSVELGHPWELPVSDLDLWERHGLPWVGDKLAPVARFFSSHSLHGVERPDARQLAFLEGLMRALRRMTEEKLDAGRWAEEVPTFRGPLRFVLSLPGLPSPEELEELAAPEDGTPAKRVEKLVERARWATRREALRLARRALEIWPDCAEAYTLLGGRAPDAESASRLFAAGMAAAERALGPEAFDAGHFGELAEARPYLWARFGLAQALLDLGRKEEAAAHFRELLRLDPGDYVGARQPFASLLLELGLDDEAEEALDWLPDEPFSDVVYLRVLLAFRREGDSPEARRRLREALKRDRAFPLLLVGKFVAMLENGDPILGAENEFAESAAWLGRLQAPWRNTPGALAWLAERTEAAKPKKVAGKRQKAPRRKAKKAKKKRR
jgi:tetratricopeptide (TPR) repeat protein